MPDQDQRDIQAKLREMFPVERNEDYVTRGELHRELEHIASAIEISVERLAGKMQRWLIGIGMFLLTTFGAGTIAAYTTAIRALDEIQQIGLVAKSSQERLDSRSSWIARQERWNLDQDVTLRKIDPTYEPLPYDGPPR